MRKFGIMFFIFLFMTAAISGYADDEYSVIGEWAIDIERSAVTVNMILEDMEDVNPADIRFIFTHDTVSVIFAGNEENNKDQPIKRYRQDSKFCWSLISNSDTIFGTFVFLNKNKAAFYTDGQLAFLDRIK